MQTTRQRLTMVLAVMLLSAGLAEADSILHYRYDFQAFVIEDCFICSPNRGFQIGNEGDAFAGSFWIDYDPSIHPHQNQTGFMTATVGTEVISGPATFRLTQLSSTWLTRAYTSNDVADISIWLNPFTGSCDVFRCTEFPLTFQRTALVGLRDPNWGSSVDPIDDALGSERYLNAVAGITPNPIPEPSTWILLASGLGAIIGLRTYRRR